MIRLPSWLPDDKLMHFGLAAGVAAVLLPFLGALEVTVLVALIGFSKEWWDHKHPPHQVTVSDAAATYAGGLWAAFWALAGASGYLPLT